MIRLLILASGSGTNAENICNYFNGHNKIVVSAIASNNKDAYVHERAKKLAVPSFSFSKSEFYEEAFLNQLKNVDYIILAGFLWLIPKYLIAHFPEHIINIHPSLLPDYGGKGMYGMNVHRAIIENGEKESGISIHLASEEYDKGQILFQINCQVKREDTVASLAEKIHQLEHRYFPRVIEDFILG